MKIQDFEVQSSVHFDCLDDRKWIYEIYLGNLPSNTWKAFCDPEMITA